MMMFYLFSKVISFKTQSLRESVKTKSLSKNERLYDEYLKY